MISLIAICATIMWCADQLGDHAFRTILNLVLYFYLVNLNGVQLPPFNHQIKYLEARVSKYTVSVKESVVSAQIRFGFLDVTFSKSTPDLSCPACLYRVVVEAAAASAENGLLVEFVV